MTGMIVYLSAWTRVRHFFWPLRDTLAPEIGDLTKIRFYVFLAVFHKLPEKLIFL
jgi:hypothetical protein